MMRKLEVAVVALLLLSSAAFAQEGMRPAPKCDAVAAPPPALSGWSSKADIAAGTKTDGLSAASLTVDHAATVALHPTRDVSFITQPDKPGGSVAHGGLLAVVIDKAGTYQINLSSGAWIDLVKDGKSVLSTAHAPGPACTGIRKTVQFPLEPGRYVLQISANADPTIMVMVSKAS
jgi:hypothetical protein